MYVKLISIKFVKNIKFNLASAFLKMSSYITIDDVKIGEAFFDNVNISTTDTSEHVLSIWSNPDHYTPNRGENLINNIKLSTEEKSIDEKLIVFSDDEKIFEDIINKYNGKFEYEFDTIKNRNIKIYISNKKDNTNINISDIKYASNNTVEIEYENKKVMSDEELNRETIQNLVNAIRNHYSLTSSESDKLYEIQYIINNKEPILNLQFPIERPAILEELTDNDKSTINSFISHSAYRYLLSEDERNIMSEINNYYSIMTKEEKDEALIMLYNKYEMTEEMFVEKENEYKVYLIKLYKKYAGDRNIIEKYKSDDTIIESLNIDELLNKIGNVINIKPFEQNEREVINNINYFMNNKNSLMNLQFPIERPIGNKMIHGGKVYVFK